VPRHSEATLAAIKHAVDIVALVGEYLPGLTRSGSKFKALCPFHDDHNPSLELNPERQSYKCWSCGAGGDVFDFVKEYERVDFPEAVRMLAERAGVSLESAAPAAAGPRGPSKAELLAVNGWAEAAFAEALGRSEVARAYAAARGVSGDSAAQFRLGYAPGERGWLVARAKKAGFPVELLERAGLVSRPAEAPGTVRERFRGRLMFPIHDPRGRAIGFGGRVLPEVEAVFAAAGKRVAKYLNGPETPLFQKRRVLYAADLARAAAREAGWVAVVEGYTDVIAAHQVGLRNVVGTLGTALGDDHVTALRRLADRVVLVFDGDDAGQNAADRALELFLGHELDLRVLELPGNLDPCDFLLKEGAGPFREMAEAAVDPLQYLVGRARKSYDLNSIEEARRAAEWILKILVEVPVVSRAGLGVKVNKAINSLAYSLRLPPSALLQMHRELELARKARARVKPGSPTPPAAPADDGRPIRLVDLDVNDKELLRLVLTEPAAVGRAVAHVAVSSLRDAPLRTILQACYDLYAEGQPATFERVSLRLEEPSLRALAASLVGEIDPAPLPEGVRPAPWQDRLAGVLARVAERDREERFRAVEEALKGVDPVADPEAYRALNVELFRLSKRPVKNTITAS
jgi:DNA primase